MEIRRLTNIKLRLGESEEKLRETARRALKCNPAYFRIVKKSLDARDKGNIFYVYSIEFAAKEVAARGGAGAAESERLPENKLPAENKPVLIVGAGPAGLFCALRLLKRGITPLLIERGEAVEEREKTLKYFHETGELNTESNVSFGDGAPEEIAYLNKPHIGSDNLKTVVKNMREHLLKHGTRVIFNACLTDIFIENGKIARAEIARKDGNGRKTETIDVSAIVLAVGHSARDTFELLRRKGVALTKKDFAVGVRIEHLQSAIGFSQYGEKYKLLPPADYKCVFHGERAAFTFCMCPGGYVMAAASEESGVVTNGMSNYARSGENANSALIVQVTAADYPEDNPLAGVEFQRKIERAAYRLGGGKYVAPAQRAEDFLKGRASSYFGEVKPTYPRGVVPSELSAAFPKPVYEELKRAIVGMDARLKGFACPDAVLTAAETRTSSPVRILRGDNLQSVSAEMLFPCGEGAGYAGGITSSAADGIRVADAVYKALLEE